MSLSKNILFFCVLLVTMCTGAHDRLAAQTPAGSQVVNQGRVIFTYKSFPAETLKTNTVSFTVLGVPSYVVVSAETKYLFGRAGEDSSKITVAVQDTLHNMIPEQSVVTCTTDLGTFSNGLKTITLATTAGKAETYLHSATVQNDKMTATVTASTTKPSGERISASTELTMYPGAVTGIVLNGSLTAPFKGAVAVVTDQTSAFVGADTTKEDGRFFIALNKRVTMYHLRVIVVDNFGDTVASVTEIDATTFPRPAARIPNVIAGRIQYQGNGEPIPAAGVSVYLDSIPRASATRLTGARTSSANFQRVAEQLTDEKGRFKFDQLPPAVYRLSIDSTKFQHYSGQRIIADTLAGTFTINVNIDVRLDSLVDVQMKGASVAHAGDTLRLWVAATNNGNIQRFNAALIDTLPRLMRFVSMQKGSFSSASFDSVKRILRWSADTLAITSVDSASVTVALARNIPDSTVVGSTVWFIAPGEVPRFRSTAATMVRSQPVLHFSSYFAGRDSIAAGDSLLKVYTYRNSGTDSLRGVTIVDTLFGIGKSVLSLPEKADAGRVRINDSVIVITVGAVSPDEADTITVAIATDRALAAGSRIRSAARFMANSATVDSSMTDVPIVDMRSWTSLLKVLKTANKKIAEIGDIVTYQIQIANASGAKLHAVGVYDLLPHAFTYVKHSARWNGRALEPSINQSVSGLTWSADSIGAGSTATLVYQCALGADALESEGMNTARAAGETPGGIRLVSEPSQWQVTVRPGVFTEKGLIIGKVFYDDDRNAFQEEGENGIKDVELWMEDGTRITTGDDGKFSVPEMKPGQHVLRVNERTLPAGAELLDGATEFAKDPVSRFVRVTSSGIAKANFFVKRNMADTLSRTAVRSLRMSAQRRATCASVGDTVEMSVSFTYKGVTYLQRIELFERLALGMRFVDGSARFNERSVAPIVKGDSLIWRLGRGGTTFTGTLTYRTTVADRPTDASARASSSVVALMTADSITILSDPLTTEHRSTASAANETIASPELTSYVVPSSSNDRKDTVTASTGDQLVFTIGIRIDPHRKPATMVLVDTLASSLAVDTRSIELNGVPLPGDRIVIAPVGTARAPMQRTALDLTHMTRPGKNIVSYKAMVRHQGGDTVLTTRSVLTATDQYSERRTAKSDDVVITIKGVKAPVQNVPIVAKRPESLAQKIPAAAKRTEPLMQSGVPAPVRPESAPVRTTAIVQKTPATIDTLGRNVKKATLRIASKQNTVDETNRPDWLVYKRITGKYFVQISSWESQEKARLQAERFMKKTGVRPILYEHYKNGKIYFAVQFGPFKTETEARAEIDEHEPRCTKKPAATTLRGGPQKERRDPPAKAESR